MTKLSDDDLARLGLVATGARTHGCDVVSIAADDLRCLVAELQERRLEEALAARGKEQP